MTERGRARLAGRGRTIAALVVVGAFYGAASVALTSTDPAPQADPAAASSQGATHDVALVGSTRTGQDFGLGQISGRLPDLCRLPGIPLCTTKTVTLTKPASTVTTTLVPPPRIVTTTATVTPPAQTVTTTVTPPAQTVTTTITPQAQTVTSTVTDYKTKTETKYITKTVTVVNP